MLDLKKQIDIMINQFNQKMQEEGKPIRAKLTDGGIEIRYDNILQNLKNVLQQSGLKFELIVTENAIMIKTTIDDIKKIIIEQSGLDPNLLKNAKFIQLENGDYSLIATISLGMG